MSRSYATAFQAAGLCLKQGSAKYGAYAMREQLVEDAFAKGEPPLPYLAPVTRLVGPHCFRNVALFQKGSFFRLCCCALLPFNRPFRAVYKKPFKRIRAGAPLSLPVNTISLSHTVCALPRSCAPFFGTFSAARKSTSKTSDFCGTLERARACPPIFGTFPRQEKYK